MKLLCWLFGHKCIRTDPRPGDTILPDVYRKTCERCGKWKEFDGDGNLLLSSDDE